MIGIHRLMKPWYVWRPWQSARRVRAAWIALPDRDCALRVAWEVSLRADPRMTIGRSIQTTGLHDPAVTEILARLIRPGDAVVDAGAHIGYMTILSALASGPSGQVVAWEPHPELFAVLERNVAEAAPRRRLARITLRNAALGRTPGRAELVIPDGAASNDGTSHLAHAGIPAGQSVSVKVETIDEILGDARVGVMKLDVEGSELQVLRGASRALRNGRIRHIVFEEQ